MSQHLNLLRAGHVATAIEAFEKQLGRDDERTAILDLITDLGHLSHHYGIDFVQLVAQAVSAWAYERRHPGGDGPSPQVTIEVEGRKPKLAWPRRVGER